MRWAGMFAPMRVLMAMLAALLAALVLWQLRPDATVAQPQPRDASGRDGGAQQAADAATAVAVEPVAAAESGEVPTREAVAAPDQWTLRGIIKRGYQVPFPGAKVVAEWFDGFATGGEPRLTVATDAGGSGEFTFALPRPERAVTLRVRSDVPGAKQGEETLLALPERRLPEQVELHCYPIDGALAGRVVDEERRPIPGARVVIPPFSPHHTTDQDGRFRAEVSSAAVMLSLLAAAPGFALARQRLPAPAPGSTAEAEIVLNPGATLRGRVVDEQGMPVEGADVQTFYTLYYGSVTTGPDGTFVLDYLDPGRELDGIYARKPGYVLGRVDYNLRQRKESYEILLRRGVRVTGTVLEAGGAPLPGAKLYIGFGPSAYDRLDALAREGGRFEFAPVAPGEHFLVVECPGCAYDVRSMTVPADVGVHELTVRMQEGHEVGGIVVDAGGKPLAGVGVHAREAQSKRVRGIGNGRYIGESTSTDAAGRFRIADMPGPIVDLEFYGREVIRHVASDLAVGRFDHRIELQRPGRLAGRVVDARSGEPIRAFRVRFLRSGTHGYSATWVREGREFRTEDGIWRTETDQLIPGTEFLVEVSAKGHGRAVRSMEAAVDPDPQQYVFSLAPGQTVRGRVLAADTGLPVARARVAMFDEHHPLNPGDGEDHHGRITDTTDAGGTFTLADVPLGRISLVVDHPDWPRASDGPIEVGEHAIVERVVLLQPPGQIRGIAVDGEGRALGGARVWIRARGMRGPRSADESVVCGADGRFESSATLAPGTYEISMSAPPREPGAPVLVAGIVHELAGGEKAELRLGPTGACRLRLAFRSSDGVPLASELRVHLSPIDAGAGPREGPPACTLAAPASGLEVRGLLAGRYSVHASSPDGRFAIGKFELAGGSTPLIELEFGRR